MPEKTGTFIQHTSRGVRLVLTLGLFGTPLALAQDDVNTLDLPDLIVRVAPEYPGRARARGVEGYVVIAYDINKNGGVSDPRVVESSPDRIFDRAALDAVMKWKYQPRLENGAPVNMAGVQTKITFTLRE